MLTALTKVFTASPLLEAIVRYFLVCIVVFFSIAWEPFYNTLMVVRLKIFMGVLTFAWCWFWVFFFGGGYILSIFLYFLKNVWYVLRSFAKVFLVILWQSNTKQYDVFTLFCKATLNYVRSHCWILYSSHCLEEPQIFPCFAEIFWSLRRKSSLLLSLL